MWFRRALVEIVFLPALPLYLMHEPWGDRYLSWLVGLLSCPHRAPNTSEHTDLDRSTPDDPGRGDALRIPVQTRKTTVSGPFWG